MQFKHKKKGRKLFTSRDRNHRIFHRYHPLRSAIGIILTLAIVSFLGIIGYNIVGPLVSRLHAEAETPTKTDDPFFEQSSEPVKTTEPVLLSTAAPVTTDVTTMTSSVTATTVHTSRFGADSTLAFFITPETVSDLQLLDTAAEHCAALGYSAVVLPMKLSGGKLLYASTVKDATACAASAEEAPSPEDILSVLDAHGLSGIAQIDLLTDNLFPAAFTDGSFLIPENQKRWLDKAESDGGKPWISPYSDHTRKYLSSLASELMDAGFRSVICHGIGFPKFFKGDESLLGKQVTDQKRRQEALTGVMNTISEKVPAAAFSFSLFDIINKKEEAFVPEEMHIRTVCMEIDLSKLKSPFIYNEKRYALGQLSDEEKVIELLGLSKQILGEINLIPCFIRGSLNDDQLNTVIETAHSAGYSDIYISD